MAKELTPAIQNQLDSKRVKIKFVLYINGIEYSDYLVQWSLQNSKEFGAAQATFVLNNQGGIFGEEGSNALKVGGVVQFSEYFETDPTEFKRFYGLISQRSIKKTSSERSITLVCLDYISTLQYQDIDLECEGTKIAVDNEYLTPNYLPAPNDTLAHIFNFANNSIAEDPRPIIMIKNRNTDAEDPQYDGFEIMYENGQLKLGFPLNAKDNYDVIAVKYSFYVKGIYAEDILEDILTEPDGYGHYLFDENTAEDVITNHLTDSFQNIEGAVQDYLTPNYLPTEITIDSQLNAAILAGATSLTVDDASGFPNSGQGSINGDIFTWSSKSSNTLQGIPSTGTYSLNAHADNSYVKYTDTYAAGKVWYLKYSNIFTSLVAGNFTIPGSSFSYLDKRYGRIILTSAISTGSIVTCNVNYSFKTLQASGIEINRIVFRSREIETRFDAIKKLQEYLAPNYLIRTRGDNKIWSSYLSQKVQPDYTLQLETSLNYLEDEDLYTRVIFFGKNKNPTNLMFNEGVTFVGTGETYKATSSNTDLAIMRAEGNYWVYGTPISGVGKILLGTINPIVYLNAVPIDNQSHIIAGQQVMVDTTTRTETTVSGGGK